MIRMGVLKYNCLKCGERVVLEFRPLMSEKTVECFGNMFDAKLCLDCHCDSKIPEVAECLFH